MSKAGIATLSALLVLCASPVFAAGPGREPTIEIVELRAEDAPTGLPVAPWVRPGHAGWQESDPAFEISDPEGDARATGWFAVTDRHVLMKVIVRDDVHVNSREGADIWDGDALQIGVDARGDGSGTLPPNTRMVGPDDASITVALTDGETKVWAHFQGKYGRGYLADGARDYPCTVRRDEEQGRTVYEIAFPWEDFQTAPGMSPLLGLTVQVNDTDEGPGQRRISWGDGAGGEPRPGLFERLTLGRPPGPVAAAEVTRTHLWRPDHCGKIVFAVARGGEVELHARMGDLRLARRLEEMSLAEGVRRFAVRGYPGRLPAEPVELEADLLGKGGEVLATAKAELDAPGLAVGRLRERIQELLTTSPHPLFSRHLRSVGALVQAEWNRALLVVDENPERAEGVARDATTILDGLRGEAGRWESYASGARSLVFARISPQDSTLQYHLLTLPTDWDPDREYPLVVTLHGAGPSHFLFYVQAQFHEREATTDETPAWRHDYFALAPWGRGNSGYDESAEDDVWEAVREVKRDFRVDGDRQYLTGHSMGGGGTWSIGLRTPDRWAAICVVAGGTWGTPMGIGLGRNAAHLPVRIWHGETDGAVSVEQAREMQAELRRYGNEPDVVLVPDQGHSYPPEARRENIRWLLQHERRRPDSFAFVCDTWRHRGVWGVWMDRDVSAEPFPRFDCRIEGSKVYVNSRGTPGLDVDLGEGGLGLSGGHGVLER